MRRSVDAGTCRGIAAVLGELIRGTCRRMEETLEGFECREELRREPDR